MIGIQIAYALLSLAAVILLWRTTGAGSVDKAPDVAVSPDKSVNPAPLVASDAART